MHPGPQLVDHLLVELADAPAGRPGLADHEHAEQAAVRDRAAARDGHDPGVAPALDRVGDAVPDDPRLELGELVGRIGAGEHPEDALEDLAGQRLVRRRPGDGREQVVHGPAVHHGHRHELLGEDVERVARDRVVSMAPSCIRRVTTAHSSRSPRYFGKMTPLLGRPDLVPGPPDPLEAAGDARRALDLDDEVDRAHVDAELEAGRGDERRQPAGLELLLDLEPLLAGDAAVVRPDELLAGELVEPLGQPLREPPAVGEDDRAAMAPDELEDRAGGSTARCSSACRRCVAGPPGCSSSGRTSPIAAMSSTGTTTWSSSGLRAPASTIVTSRSGPTPPRNRAIASSGRCVADRPIRCIGRASGLPAAEVPPAARATARGARRASCRRSRGPRR